METPYAKNRAAGVGGRGRRSCLACAHGSPGARVGTWAPCRPLEAERGFWEESVGSLVASPLQGRRGTRLVDWTRWPHRVPCPSLSEGPAPRPPQWGGGLLLGVDARPSDPPRLLPGRRVGRWEARSRDRRSPGSQCVAAGDLPGGEGGYPRTVALALCVGPRGPERQAPPLRLSELAEHLSMSTCEARIGGRAGDRGGGGVPGGLRAR